MNYQYDIDIQIFIFLNLLLILIVGLIYFVTKEWYRIRSGNIGRLGILVIGSFIGVGIVFCKLYFSNPIYDSTPLHPEYELGNGIILNPSIIIILIFVLLVDRRLVFPLFFFETIGFLLIVPFDKKDVIGDAALWTNLFLKILEYMLLVILFYFSSLTNIIKKNGIKLFIVLIFYILIKSTVETIYFLAIASQNSYSILELFSAIYLLLYAFIQFGVVFVVERIYSNFSALETFSTKDDVSYYKMSLAQNSLLKLIDEKKINIGLLSLFQIKTSNNENESNVLRKIKDYTENKYKNTFYFKASANYYGAFFELSNDFKLDVSLANNKSNSRTKEDELHIITNEIARISNEENAQIIAAGSIYGIHSCSISELIEQSKFLMSPIVSRANTNSLVIYDFQRVKERLDETSKVRNLPLDIESMNINYLRALSEDEIFYPSISFKNEEDYLLDIFDNNNIDSEQNDILLRFTSYQSLRKFDKEKGNLIIYYSSLYLNSESFKIRDFLKKVNRHLNVERLIIGINTKKLKETKILKNNLNQLRLVGIRFALINPSKATQEEHDLLNPDFILDPKTNPNPLKIKKIKLGFNTNATLLNPNLTK